MPVCNAGGHSTTSVFDIPELVHVVPGDAVELHRQHARLGPFAVGPEFDVASHGMERVAAQIVGELLLIGAAGLVIASPSTCMSA